MWRPNGSDLGRALKFVAWFLTPSGEYQRKELSGPASFIEWRRSWRVFAFAMEVLRAATRTRLKRYLDTISEMNEDYPQLWWLVACADHKMRKANLERIRRRLAGEHAELTAVGLKSPFNPDMPWDLAFREAARDKDFWHKEVDKKVLQFTTAQRTRLQLTDPGFGTLRFANNQGKRNRTDDETSGEDAAPRKRPGKKQRDKAAAAAAAKERQAPPPPAALGGAGNDKGTGKGKNKDRAPDGRYLKDRAGVQLCWAWNSNAPCSSEPCKRSHRCEWCRGQHRSWEHRGR